MLAKPLVEGAAAEVLQEVRGRNSIEAADEVGAGGQTV